MIPEYAQKKIKSVSMTLGSGTLSLETGRLAEQAGGAVVVQFGESIVLSTVVGDKKPKEDLPFFPLTVDYEERMYAAGKIPGGFIKREGRPTEAAILAARLTDRPLRPLFPKGYRAPVQVMTTVLSADQKEDPDILSIIGASAALTISPIPFDGPVGAVRIGFVDGRFIVNPTFDELEISELDLVVAGTEDAIMMVEGHASQIPEEQLLEAIDVAHENIRKIVALQHELAAQVDIEKWPFVAPEKNQALLDDLRSFLDDRLREAVRNRDKVVRLESTSGLEADAIAALTEVDDTGESRYTATQVSDAYQTLLKEEVRNGILDEGVRPDGRTTEEIRPIWAQAGYLPRAHGSAIFTRGQTQVLTVATVGSTAEEQRLDSISPEDHKRYIHHYNFPPYSVGEARPLRGASRRDIGHGALAERALIPVLPSEEEFPYTLRLVSEVVSSNGSTSMASVCGSTLALMDAGVPIAKPVAGVAMGLVLDPAHDRYTVLTDIQGMEDALGDMDFKVAGTESGVTAIQMDIKVKGITIGIMRQALSQAHTGRQFILGKMLEALPAPRAEMSKFAPKVETLKIDVGKIGAVIGPGGKMIRSIQEETNSKIDIQDDGTVSIASPDAEGREAAKAKILGLTTEVKVERGDKFTGKVVSIMPFGAFVEILPGKDGLVHISEISEDPSVRVNNVEDVLNIGDEIEVQVIEVAPNGKISLSRRAALTGVLPDPKPARPRDDRGPRRPSGGSGGPRPR
ncbi:MAG: polyribonucleotide nucleotidyltransferase [Thermomicrobiales bacterium]